MRIIFPLAAVALIGGSVMAASPAKLDRDAVEAASLEKALAGKVAGKPRSCISLSRAPSSQIIGANAIIYRENRHTLFVNRPRGGCSGLRDGQTLVTRTPSDRLCSGDIARVVELTTGFEGPSCVLGEFTPYTN